MVVLQFDSREKMEIVNPATKKIIKVVEQEANVKGAVARAKEAQKEWAKVPIEKRKECINRFRELLQTTKEELAASFSEETGKPVSQALDEINVNDERIQFLLDNVENALKPRVTLSRGTSRHEVRYEPLGAILNISAWNFPLFVGVNVYIAALLTGNSVLYKPSEHATLFGLKIAEMLHTCGVPKEVFIPIVGGGSVAQEALNCEIDGVYFTGSNRTGTKIAEAVSSKLLRVQLELGGKDPAYVVDDVDVEKTAERIAVGCFYNAGQSCCSVERLYVHANIYDKFMEAFLKYAATFKMGDPSQKSTNLGPLTLPNQGAFLEKQVQDAVAKGATIALGGKRGEGAYFEATVLTNVNHTMDVMRDESFGPIVGVMRVNSDQEAVMLMNDTKYGLASSVHSESKERAEYVMSQMDSGTVYWNACDFVSPYVPWTGRKASGIGCTLGVEGIHAFVKTKSYQMSLPMSCL